MQDSIKNRGEFSSPQLDLWSIVRGTPQIDPNDLLAAIELETQQGSRDFRTRLLIRDSILALERRSSKSVVWNSFSADAKRVIERIAAEDLGATGFPTLENRIMQRTDPQTILQFLRDLGDRIPGRIRLDIGGSGALILAGLLRRNTEDLDAVNEIPVALREEHELLNSLATRYGLRLAHFQSHYLPKGWDQRLRSVGRFGGLDIYLVDEYDILLGKLFSSRDKDLDDLRMLLPCLDRTTAVNRLRECCESFLAEPTLRANAERNWYIVFGDRLPQ
jgi:hypothetical protein